MASVPATPALTSARLGWARAGGVAEQRTEVIDRDHHTAVAGQTDQAGNVGGERCAPPTAHQPEPVTDPLRDRRVASADREQVGAARGALGGQRREGVVERALQQLGTRLGGGHRSRSPSSAVACELGLADRGERGASKATTEQQQACGLFARQAGERHATPRHATPRHATPSTSSTASTARPCAVRRAPCPA